MFIHVPVGDVICFELRDLRPSEGTGKQRKSVFYVPFRDVICFESQELRPFEGRENWEKVFFTSLLGM